MSRIKQCTACGTTDDLVAGYRLCAFCLDDKEAQERAARNSEEQHFQAFMSLPEEERWREVWEILQRIRQQ